MAGADEIRWAQRVRQDKVRRLYALDAKGILDEELINDVGYSMLARCESIRAVTRAHLGRAACPCCKREIEHTGAKEHFLTCPCGWRGKWRDYHRTYQGKQLVAGHAYPSFLAFIERWPPARTPRDKMLAIDALIHAFHGEFKGHAGRPAACNVIEGTMLELVTLLDDLAYGPRSTAEVAERARRWREATRQSWWRHVRTRQVGGDAD